MAVLGQGPGRGRGRRQTDQTIAIDNRDPAAERQVPVGAERLHAHPQLRVIKPRGHVHVDGFPDRREMPGRVPGLVGVRGRGCSARPRARSGSQPPRMGPAAPPPQPTHRMATVNPMNTLLRMMVPPQKRSLLPQLASFCRPCFRMARLLCHQRHGGRPAETEENP